MRNKPSALQLPLLDSIQNGTRAYMYKSTPCLKSPFDLALYQMLVWTEKPRTIIEIGSNAGGSALWLADLAESITFCCFVRSLS